MHIRQLTGTLVICLAAAGCRTATQHQRAADRAAGGIIEEYERAALGTNTAFSIERPSDILRNRLILEQGLAISTNLHSDIAEESLEALPNPLPLSLSDMLTVAARNSREYQEEKERVFRAALDLDLSRDSYRSAFSALFSSGIDRSDSDGDKTGTVNHDGQIGLTRALQSGASLSTKIAVDLVNLLTGDKSSTLGLLADATVTIPLLGGAGKSIAREPLTQAERTVLYSIWRLERFKRELAVDITSASLGVLRRIEEVKNTEGNYERIKATRERTEKLGEAGRLDNIQVDQARQNEFRAKNSLVSVRQALESAMDNLKITLGLPVDAAIALDSGELQLLADQLSESLVSADGDVTEDQMASMVRKALEARLDMRIAIMQLEDAERQVAVARDDLRASVKLKGGASLVESDSDEDGESVKSSKVEYSGLLEIDLPWEKTRERTQYRKSLLALDEAKRDVEEREDRVKASVRDAVRRRKEALEAYRIQLQARELAEKRVKSIKMFQDAGRATVRDALEAEESLLSAQNDALSSLVSCQITTLELLKDLEMLQVDSNLRIEDNIGDSELGLPIGKGEHGED